MPQYALPYVHERKQFGVPIGTFQLMQGKIADMYTKVSASRAYLYSVARGTSFSRSPFASLRSSTDRSAQLATLDRSPTGCVCVEDDKARRPYASLITRLSQDCAGAILYSSDRATEVCLEALQMLGCVFHCSR